ncbi:MAG: GNAT family N-acetyltransferase [Oscillospiraceae bacterium]|nr:GNAT family N-acetyltransferase [Oscillospiraceae bacterium]
MVLKQIAPKLRRALPQDDVFALWRHCFPGKENESCFHLSYRPEKTFVFADSQRVYSMLHMEIHAVMLMGKSVAMGYFFGIGTHQDYRRQGYAGWLLEQAMFECYLRNIPIASLIPCSEQVISCYSKHGFRQLAHRYVCTPAHQGQFAKEGDIPYLSRMYQEAFPNRVERTDRAWRRLLREYTVNLTHDGYQAGYGTHVLEQVPIALPQMPHQLSACVRVTKADTLCGMFPEIGLQGHGIDKGAPWNNKTACPGGKSIEEIFFSHVGLYINLLHN